MSPQAGAATWCFLLRDEHKESLNFHPRGHNRVCHWATYPAQHLHHSTGDASPVFLQGTGINQRELSDHRESDNILFKSSVGELQPGNKAVGARLCLDEALLACPLPVGRSGSICEPSPTRPERLVQLISGHTGAIHHQATCGNHFDFTCFLCCRGTVKAEVACLIHGELYNDANWWCRCRIGAGL